VTLAGSLRMAALAGCAPKPTPATLRPPPPPAGNAPAPAAPAAVATKPAPAAKPAPPQAAAPAKPTRISPADAKILNESLARIEDALFDYDKFTIRADAAKTLEGDVGVSRGMLQKYPSTSMRMEDYADERG